MRRIWTVVLCLTACGDSSPDKPIPDANLGEATLSVNPTMIDFGPVGGGDPTGTLVMLTVSNTGGRASGAVRSQLSFTDASQFRIVSNGCETGIVAAFGECSLQMQFRPDLPSGVMHANLLIDATPGGDLVVPLTGTGVVDQRPRLMASTSTAAFGDQALATTSAPFMFTITNPGTTPTGAINVGLAGTNPTSFGVTTTCGAALAPLASCMLGVSFHPSTAGNYSADVSLTASPGTSLTLNVTGHGIDTALTGAPSSSAFGPISIGAQGTAKTFTITNTGSHASGPINITPTGLNQNDFLLDTNACVGNNLQPGASCNIDVRFAPQALGARTANAVASGSGATATLVFTGSGVTTGGGVLLPGSTMLAFTDQAVASPSAPQSFTVMNTGTITTGTITLPITGTGAASYGATSNCTTLAPAASCTVMVTFTPTATGMQQASITATAVGATVTAVPLQGTGI